MYANNNRVLCRYKSQLEYGAHGGRICTVIARGIAEHFVSHGNGYTPITQCMSRDTVDRIMRNASHFFATTEFGRRESYISLDEMEVLKPLDKHAFKHVQLAGQLSGGPENEHDDILCMPLSDLLQRLRDRDGVAPLALLVTFNEHTTAYLSQGHRKLYKFDSLPGILIDVSNGGYISASGTPPETAYNGMLIEKRRADDDDDDA